MVVAVCLLNIYSSFLQEPSQWHVEYFARLNYDLVFNSAFHDHLLLA